MRKSIVVLAVLAVAVLAPLCVAGGFEFGDPPPAPMAGVARITVTAGSRSCTTRLAALLSGPLDEPTITITVPYVGSDEQCLPTTGSFQNLTLVVHETRGFGWVAVAGEGLNLDVEPGNPDDQAALALLAGGRALFLRALVVEATDARHVTMQAAR
jgi:hypothetical protein